jgi:hypothetical protein
MVTLRTGTVCAYKKKGTARSSIRIVFRIKSKLVNEHMLDRWHQGGKCISRNRFFMTNDWVSSIILLYFWQHIF